MKTRICSKCKRELPATTEYFYAEKRRKCGLRSKCKECHIKQTEQWQEENKEHDEERKRQYYENNKEQISIVKKEYMERNKEHHRKLLKRYYIENREYFTEYSKQWRKNNPEKSVQISQRRRAKKKELDATLTLEQWEQIKADFNYRCAYCGMTEEEHHKEFNEQLHQEHFIPLSKDGEYTHNNIIPACKSCNSGKNVKDFFEWYPEQDYYSKTREKKILKYLNYAENGEQQLTIAI